MVACISLHLKNFVNLTFYCYCKCWISCQIGVNDKPLYRLPKFAKGMESCNYRNDPVITEEKLICLESGHVG